MIALISLLLLVNCVGVTQNTNNHFVVYLSKSIQTYQMHRAQSCTQTAFLECLSDRVIVSRRRHRSVTSFVPR